MRRSLVVTLILAPLAGFACSDPANNGAAPSPSAQPTPSPRETALTSATDAGVAKDDLDAGSEWQGPWAGALFMQTPIMSDMEWPRAHDDDDANAKKKRDKEADPRDKVVRLGYMRQGAKVPVLAEAHKKSNCQEGWYELVSGGFVCGKYASIDLTHPRFRTAAHLPDMNAPLPYQYGYNIKNGTPLYRHVPSHEERLMYEPWIGAKKAPPKPRDDDGTTAAMTLPVVPVSASGDDLDAGVFLATQRTTATSDDPLAIGVAAAGTVDAGIPWYLRDYDGGKPLVTLDELKGEGPMARRMVKGFYLALDKEFSSGGKWWKTTGGMLAPYERIYVQKPVSEYHGAWLSQLASHGDSGSAATESGKGSDGASANGSTNAKWPGVGFIMWVHAKKWIVTVDKKHVNPGDSVSRFTIVRLTGDTTTIGGLRYDETDDGWWMRANEGTKTDPGPPPSDLQPGEKWIDVNLSSQTMVAFEGTTPVYATIVSTGKHNVDDHEKDHATPPGSFRIREKHIAATMDGDVASDGPYSIEDVPWIMYFNGSYALHGAFWHGNWGHTQSHGCVNLSPLDAKAMFGWTEPRLPEGWHGVMATTDHPGTRVVVHGESPH